MLRATIPTVATVAGRYGYFYHQLLWRRRRSPGSDRLAVGRLPEDIDGQQREAFARGDSHRAGLTLPLPMVLENLLGAGPQCSVDVIANGLNSNRRSQNVRRTIQPARYSCRLHKMLTAKL
jgi:hypothetical protein